MKRKTKGKLLGRYIITDPRICHGQPTFRGTRIMVWQVLEMIGRGMAWETVIEECHHCIKREAIAEAMQLSSEAFLRHADEFVLEVSPT